MSATSTRSSPKRDDTKLSDTEEVTRLRILISAGWLGGAGGVERSLYCVLQTLKNHQVDLVVREQLGGPLAKVPENTKVYSSRNWRWRFASSHNHFLGPIVPRLVNPWRRPFLRYDVHIQYLHGPDLSRNSRAGVRVFLLCGKTLPGYSDRYDFLGLEAPDNDRFLSVDEQARHVLLPPPYLPLAAAAERPPQPLPGEFFLTVFNPYAALKGMEDLASAADRSPLPIVWCHSSRTLSFTIDPHLANHPNIVHVDDPSPEEMRFLYENCRAYLAFSRSEGFGWAATDAMHLSREVVTRPIGVFSFPEAEQPGVHFVGERWEFDWSRLSGDDQRPSRSLEWLSSEAFDDHLQELWKETVAKNSGKIPKGRDLTGEGSGRSV